MSLFEEAVADARKLKELAELNAKNKILESITPKIRQIIEQELVDDEGDEPVLTMDDVLMSPDEDEEDPGSKIDIDVHGDATFAFSTGEVDIVDDDEYEDEDEILTLNQESARALAKVLKNSNSPNRTNYDLMCQDMVENIRKLDRVLQLLENKDVDPSLRESVRKSYTRLLVEVKSLRTDAILTKRADEKKSFRSGFNKVLKELKTMSRRHAETLFDKLFEKMSHMEELDVVLDDEDLETLGVEDTAEANVEDLDVTVSMTGDEEVGEEEADEEVGAEEELDLGELDLVLSDEDLEILGVEDTEDVDVTGLDVGVEFAGEEEEAGDEELGEEMEEVYEIDEAVLRRELRRMRRIREQEEAADADPYLDHGGEDLGDVILDVDEDDLINALADEVGPVDDSEPTVEARVRRRVAERKRRRSRRSLTTESRTKKALINENRKNRVLSNRLVEAKKIVSALKNQLNEMNLFNAKLLYVNKLMQNRNLTTKQQKAIVEALDNAKTLREAKLLYKSLTVSLKKRGGSLNEGKIARTLGSSSRSIRSASPAKNGTEVDRWAVLAGINNDN